MDEDRRYLTQTAVVLLVASAGMAALYVLVAWLLLAKAASAAEEFGGVVGFQTLLTGPMLVFILLSVAFGWYSSWLAERRAACAWWVPVVMAVVAVGGGMGVCGSALTMPESAGFFTIMSFMSFVPAGLVQWWRNT